MIAEAEREKTRMDYQVFESVKKARLELATMRGWERLRIVLLYDPEHPMATRRGNVIVIEVDDDYYLREDGYVR